jgi:B-cell CLL/lymphoma 6 member B protein
MLYSAVHTYTCSYTCDRCGCRCWSIRNINRHVRLHADARPFHCDPCRIKFKSYNNLVKHFKTSRHQSNNQASNVHWSIDSGARDEQSNIE